MDYSSLDQALSSLPLGPLRYYPQIGSTNDEAARWAEAGAPDLSLVAADEQTAGRGRLDRHWFTPPEAALAFSLVLRSSLEQDAVQTGNLMRLTALGAMAVCDALQAQFGLAPEIKWPNDVLLERRKVAGILAEAHWQGNELLAAILGIGVNVTPTAVPPAAELIYPATSIEGVLGRPVDRLELLRVILVHLLEWRPRLASAEFLAAWEERLAFRGKWVRVSGNLEDPAASGQEGRLLGLEPDGSLKLSDRAGQVFSVRTGDVRLRPLE